MYKAAPFFMARCALLSKDQIKKYKKEENPDWLWKIYEREPLFREAIAIASLNLHQSIQKSNTQEKKETLFSLLKYLLRMSSRTTPFGLFSAVGWGRFAGENNLKINIAHLKKKVRPDMEWLETFTHKAKQEITIIRKTKVMVNPSIIKQGSRLVMWVLNRSTLKKEQVSIKLTSLTRDILQICQSPLLYGELEQQICKIYEQEDCNSVKSYLWNLFQQSVLVSDLEINCKQNFNFSSWVQDISKNNDELAFANWDEIANLLVNYENQKPGEGLAALEKILTTMKLEAKTTNLLQVDSYLDPCPLTLSNSIKEQLEELAEVLVKISYILLHKQDSHLDRYYRRFIEKYGTYRLVTVEELINKNTGLGVIQESFSVDITTEESKEALFYSKWLSSILLASNNFYSAEVDIEKILGDLPNSKFENLAPTSLEIYFEIVSHLQRPLQDSPLLVINPVISR